MANQKETVEIQELSKYGFKANNVYYNWSKTFKEADKTPVVPGAKFEMEIYVADSGKKYVNKILGESTNLTRKITEAQTGTPPKNTEMTPEVTALLAKAKQAFAPTKDEAMTRKDWDAKDRRISRQGVIQAAVQAVAPLVALELVFPEAEKLAEQMLAFVNK